MPPSIKLHYKNGLKDRISLPQITLKNKLHSCHIFRLPIQYKISVMAYTILFDKRPLIIVIGHRPRSSFA
uniref:Uncharacterized protein n=1 Tax=Lepeophtheirus salmonis TaxID=72036 RepID=A0A0K2UNV5_LEPSM